MMDDFGKLSSLVRTNTVHVSLPADVAFNFEKFQRVQKDILGRLGCGGCTSGHDIRWEVFRDFHVDEKLNVLTGPQLR
jgi:hypothetical protein